MLVARALKNSQLTNGESNVIYRTGHQLRTEKRHRLCPGHDSARHRVVGLGRAVDRIVSRPATADQAE